MANFVVPKQYAGKTLTQIRNELNAPFRPDVIGNENAPLTEGQKISYAEDPGSGEYQFLSKYFTPESTYIQQQNTAQNEAFAAKQKADEQAFMDVLNAKVAGQETLTAASGRIGGELNLPALRESAFNLTQTLKNIPQTQTTISKQVGISAPHLQQRIATEQGKIAPLAQEAVGQQQFGEQELGQRLGYLLQDQAKELEPFYQAQLPLLSDRLAREQANYSQDKQNELTLLLTNMSQSFAATQNDLDRANQLAVNELQYNNVKNSQSIETIGGRKVLITYDNNGNIISRVDLGSSTTGGGVVDPNKYTGGGGGITELWPAIA